MKYGSDRRNLDSRPRIVNDNGDTAGRLRLTVTENHQADTFRHPIAWVGRLQSLLRRIPAGSGIAAAFDICWYLRSRRRLLRAATSAILRGMTSTRISRHLRAPRPVVYRALLDPDAVAKWRVPAGMTSRVHWFDAREGGAFRISLTYDAPDVAGKTAANTDTYHGHFVKLVADELVVEVGVRDGRSDDEGRDDDHRQPRRRRRRH